MKKMMMILMIGILSLVLSACVTEQAARTPANAAGSAKGNAEEPEPVLEGCAAIPTLKATLETRKETLQEEQKELLMEKEARTIRLQKFKVLKLDREVKELEEKIAELEAECT